MCVYVCCVCVCGVCVCVCVLCMYMIARKSGEKLQTSFGTGSLKTHSCQLLTVERKSMVKLSA